MSDPHKNLLSFKSAKKAMLCSVNHINKTEINVSKNIKKNFNFKVTDVEMIISGTCQKHT